MSVTLSVKTDIAETLKRFEVLEPRQFPFIVSLAMNKTTGRIKEALKANMPMSLDRPTRFTLNSLMTKPATKQKLEAEVGLRDFAPKGTPASTYLMPQVHGGSRKHKRFERALILSGIMPAGYFAVPGKGAKLDSSGNLRGSFITAMLSYLKASPDSYQNRTDKSGRKPRVAQRQFFAVKERSISGRLPMGIYQRTGGSIRLVIAFVKQPKYNKRFLMFDISQKLTKQYLQEELVKAAERALATSSSNVSLSDFQNAINYF